MIQDLDSQQSSALAEGRIVKILLLAPGEENFAETPGMKSSAITDEEDTSPDRILREVGVEAGSLRSLFCVEVFKRAQEPGGSLDGRIVLGRKGLPPNERQDLVEPRALPG